jgi:streptogramin lyase
MTPTGEFTEFPIPTPNSGPTGIATGPDGNLWFTETSAGKIGRITTGGTVSEFALPNPRDEPEGIAQGPDGNLWFTEVFGDAIGRISTNGEITEFPLPSEVSRPTGIASGPDRNLWFTEEQGDRIGEITPTGRITEFPVPAPGSPRSGIAAGPDGNLWFTDWNGIGRITPTGEITEFPAGEAGFESAAGIAAGSDGNLWFAEEVTNSISRITTSGTVTQFRVPQSFPVKASPTSITSGSGGYLWFTESAADKIGRLDPGGPVPENLKPPSITGGAKPGFKLTGHPGLWTNSPTRYSYLWQDCNRSGNSCHETTRGQRYLVSARDIGHTIRVFVIARNLGGGSVPAQSAATALVRGPAENLFLGGSVHRLSLMGSNGYRISLSSYINHKYNRITLSAEKNGTYARYSVKGQAHKAVIRAAYPGLGQVTVHFVPSKVKGLPPHPGCREPSGAIEKGSFLGIIRFRGEKGFTTVDATRAHGTIVRRFRQLCRAVKRATASRRDGARRFEDVELGATVGDVRFTAHNRVGNEESSFNVKGSETRRGVYITRGLPGVTGKGSFAYNDPMTEATLAPPSPYKGRASYSGSGNPNSPMPGFYTQGTLLGSLRVFLPGLGIVPLGTGRAKADMSRSAGVTN